VEDGSEQPQRALAADRDAVYVLDRHWELETTDSEAEASPGGGGGRGTGWRRRAPGRSVGGGDRRRALERGWMAPLRISPTALRIRRRRATRGDDRQRWEIE
jgi:hypothetical protein